MRRNLLLLLFGVAMALDGANAAQSLAIMPPQVDLAFTMPTHPPQVDLAFTMPTHPPQVDLAFTMPTHYPQQPALA